METIWKIKKEEMPLFGKETKMKSIFKKGDTKTINQALKLHHDMLKKFIKLHGEPVLVHSPHDKKTFKHILKDGAIKLPSQHKKGKKQPHIEKLLGIDNCIYYGLGFPYATRYEFKYGFIFDLKYLKEVEYYKNSFVFRCSKNIVDYLDKKDPEELQKLANKNKACKQVVDMYYNKKHNGKLKMIFKFWKIEKEFSDLIQKYPDKKKLLSIIKDTKKDTLIKYPSSVRDVKKSCFSGRIQEIISRKQISLKTNPYFLGFYIQGKIPKDIMSALKKDYKGKMLFDGKKLVEIK